MTSYQSRIAEINLAEKEYQLSAAQAERERAYAQVANYGDMLGAAKGFFAEGSDGYKALQAAEQAYRLYQFASTLQAIALGGTETAATVGQNLIKSASHGVVAVARALASLPFPFNLAAGAATVAALAAIGVKIFGGGGGGGGSSEPSSSGVGTDAAVARSQSYSAMGDQNRQTFTTAIAQSVKVEIGVNDDRFNASIDGRIAPAVSRSEARTRAAVPGIVNRGMERGRIGAPVWA